MREAYPASAQHYLGSLKRINISAWGKIRHTRSGAEVARIAAPGAYKKAKLSQSREARLHFGTREEMPVNCKKGISSLCRKIGTGCAGSGEKKIA